jgi:6-phosphogluconolactonase
MSDIQNLNNDQAVAAKAAELTVQLLKNSVEKQGKALWVLAGASTPMKAYQEINNNYSKNLDWSKVWISLGDERLVPLDDPDSNWGNIEPSLDELDFRQDHLILPNFNLNGQAAEDYYNDQLSRIAENGILSIDVLWLGIGEDGHTLSLFPGKKEIDTPSFACLVNDSPKPPSSRISLTLSGLRTVKQCFVLATGETKAEVVKSVRNGNSELPISRVIKQIEDNNGQVTWLVDQAAASLI